MRSSMPSRSTVCGLRTLFFLCRPIGWPTPPIAGDFCSILSALFAQHHHPHSLHGPPNWKGAWRPFTRHSPTCAPSACLPTSRTQSVVGWKLF